jgi:formylglycine-generating enzyme required for sulfatase activity/tRNA A-37 threonylcarbamoyl transferase component Bud32
MRCLNCLLDGISLEVQVCPQCGMALSQFLGDILPPGTALEGGKYQIDHALGQGGFGITYQARDVYLDRLVAIKEFYPRELVRRDQNSGQISIPALEAATYNRWLQRFEREGRILAQLNHSGVVKVYSLFKERATAYLVMELLVGQTLQEELHNCAEGRLPPGQVATITAAIVSALDTVHREGIYHLDLKPENVMLTQDGRIVLIDFGSARQDLSGNHPQKTSTRALTPKYAPLELISGEAVGPESDLYELGMIVYELLTGECPPPVLSRLNQECWEPINIDKSWQEVLTNALRLKRFDRPASVMKWWQTYTPTDISTGTWVNDLNQRSEQNHLEAEEQITQKEKPHLHMIQSAKPLQKQHVNVEIAEILSDVRSGQPEIIIQRTHRQIEQLLENLGGEIVLEMLQIPAGTFIMGSPNDELEHWNDEEPQHQVTITSFLMGRLAVTQLQWQAVMSNNPAHFKGENHPIDNISWQDAQEFCKRLSQKTNRPYRLPSEAEWEYACRAGTTTPFHFGQTLTVDLANYSDSEVDHSVAHSLKAQNPQQTMSVGSFPANRFGLQDMHGNVWEWCEDTWHSSYVGAPTDGSAWKHGGDPDTRLLRGGSWADVSKLCRSASRFRMRSGSRGSSFGLRVVC